MNLNLHPLSPLTSPGPFTVGDYYRMAEVGILNEDSCVELLDGHVLRLAPKTPAHAACVMRLNHLLQPRVGAAAIVSVHNPVRLDQRSEPEPDITLLHPRRDYYASGHPGPADVFLIIEVADTAVAYDREVKLPFYAEAKGPEVWLVSLPGDAIQVYRDPRDGRYADVRTLRRGETMVPLAFPDLALRVDEILG